MSDLETKPALFLLGQIHANVEALLAREEANGARITKLERWQWMSAGAAAIVAFVAPFVLKLDPLTSLFR